MTDNNSKQQTNLASKRAKSPHRADSRHWRIPLWGVFSLYSGIGGCPPMVYPVSSDCLVLRLHGRVVALRHEWKTAYAEIKSPAALSLLCSGSGVDCLELFDFHLCSEPASGASGQPGIFHQSTRIHRAGDDVHGGALRKWQAVAVFTAWRQ